MQIPELSDLSLPQRMFAVGQYRLYRTPAPFMGINFFEVSMVGSIVLGEIVGLFGGWFYWHGFWGALVGGILAMWSVMLVYFCASLLCITFPQIRAARRFFRSGDGRQIIEMARNF